MVFDSNLYNQNNICRTPTMRSVLNHYSLIVKNTWYKKREDIFKYLPFFVESPSIALITSVLAVNN
jgi:hypothetical protein